MSALVIMGLIALTALWPLEPCADPSCVRPRFLLALEIDALEHAEPIAFEVDSADGSQSLQGILASGGIDVAVEYDDMNVPYKPSSGPLDRADLYQFVSSWRNRAPPEQADAGLYALITPGLIADSGRPLFGIMFDMQGREAFAVAPRTTQRYFQDREPQAVEVLQLRTFVHELLHALNRDHEDAALLNDGRFTLEAPTRCIAAARNRQWRLVEQPLMALSPATIRFFQSAASRDVLPGQGNSPYARRRTSAQECDRARVAGDTEPGWQRLLRRLQSTLSFAMASAAQAQESPQQGADESERADEPPDAQVELQVLPTPYPLGYPIAVRIVVHNTGGEALPLVERLDPAYGIVGIEYRPAGTDEWRSFQPLTWFEPTGNQEALLPPGERTEQTVPVYFGEDGWTFPEPGEYELRVRVGLGEPSGDVWSESATLRIVAPNTQIDAAALEPLLDAEGELDPAIGRLLNFGGRIGGAADMTPLESVAALYEETALGSALRLTLLSHRLRPPIDPRTGERPAPDLSAVRALLEDTCTDSGIAAMTAELLEQREQLASAEGLDEAAGGVSQATTDTTIGPAAWDGTLANGRSIPTYSDRRLRRYGPSLHFCFNETHLRREVARALRPLARELNDIQPARIVLVGHGDHTGTCRINDAVALRRAQQVRAALVAAGVDRRRIEVVSLGERRPADFAASEAAKAANRRVEILIEPPDEGEDATWEDASGPVLLRCP